MKKVGDIEVIGFYGPPGSGKSDRALIIAHENQADCLIDDGILIYNNRIVAGKSAKTEKSHLQAVRSAMFFQEKQREEVKKALQSIHPKRVLILGTSDRMVNKITEALMLPKPSKYIRIEDVAKPEEIRRAQFARHKEGKHVVPVPLVELKPYFKGYLVDPLRLFRKYTQGETTVVGERSVVRPMFSYYGKLMFSNRVIESLVRYAVKDMDNVKVQYISGEKSQKEVNGLILSLETTIRTGTPENIKKTVHTMRNKIQKEIEYTTGMSLETIRINVITGVSNYRK